MFRKLVLLLILIFSGYSYYHGTPKIKSHQATVVEQITDDTVALVFPTSHNDVTPFCAGVWVAHDVIMTSFHCVKAEAEFEAQTKEEESVDLDEDADLSSTSIYFTLANESVGPGVVPAALHRAVTYKLFKQEDIALLAVVKPQTLKKHGIAKLARSSPRPGENVHIMGHPIGLYWSYSSGVVSAYPKTIKPNILMQIAAPVFHGNSGGGAFNDDGELVGIAWFIMNTPHMGCFVYLETLRSILNDTGISTTKASGDFNP